MAPPVVGLIVGITMIATGSTLLIILLIKQTDWKMERYHAENRYRYAATIPLPQFDDVEKVTATLRNQIAELEAQLQMIVKPVQFEYIIEEQRNAPPDWPTQQIPHRTWFVQHQEEIAWQ